MQLLQIIVIIIVIIEWRVFDRLSPYCSYVFNNKIEQENTIIRKYTVSQKRAHL